ncbi:sodium/hydrogen exchanger 3-like isoform X3 [Zootermopsis nevadensis]|uniref:sodium/hydrogen exchanger 3-like isoform X3 n=1 Tax=Zootermopsis nevadensis TaxID=136037 RepID=UPI000B8EC4AB|nr:sodium/hydrogen exchanger 3-like isoform X3 [Zootermopsis nevadensis]
MTLIKHTANVYSTSAHHGCHRHSCNEGRNVTFLFFIMVLLLLLGHLGVCSGRPDALASSSSSTTSSPSGRSPIRPDDQGGFEESRPISPGPVFLYNADDGKSDVQSSKSDTKHNDSGGSKRYDVMSVDFARVETPFIIGVWIFCASLAKIGFHMTPTLSKIFPESCLLVVVGLIIGALLIVTGSMHVSPLTPDTFFLYMLPPIILDAGYFMPNRLFFDHLGTILLFAVVGTIFNTLTIGVSLWAVGQSGLFSCDTPLLDMLLFSSLISAVDPVAVLAVFEEIHVNEILYIVVFGESLLNDAVTVVLYHLFESYTEMGPSNILYIDLVMGFTSFFVVALGGTIIGVLWGFLTGLVTRYTNQVRVIEPIFIFVMAYLAYLNAELFHMSGILAITFCGITMKNYVEANISHKSHTTVKYAMKMLSSSSETIIFMFLGVATINNTHEWNLWFIVLTITFCSVYRTIGVILLTAIANRFRLHKLNKVEKFVMSYGGLRGAVAFALVLLIDKNNVKLQPMFVSTTISVIYFTVFFQGITIKPLVKVLNVKRAEKRKPTMNERIHERFMDHLMAGIEDILGRHGNYHVRDKFKRFDNRFIRPLLLRDHQGAEPKILETYSKLAMKDAMEYMRRNASTIGNISGTESMSAIFRNYTAGNINGNLSGTLNGSTSFSQLDSSTWNIDMQELEYNPSKKDLTDAKIHHLLAEELCKPYRRVREHRRLSYSRHAVNDRDLSTQPVNYRMHMNIRRMVGERKHHHKRSKRLGKDGKQNHVSFPGITQNGSAKQFSHDYINEVLQESENDGDGTKSTSREDWDSAITFTAKTSPGGRPEASVLTQITSLPGSKPRKARLIKQYSKPTVDYDDAPTVAEVSLPWRRGVNGDETQASGSSEATKKSSRELDGSTGKNTGTAECARVTTPTATETMLPWKRDDEGESTCPLKQSEFPAWCSNKEYLAYSSPSATFLGGIEQPKIASVIGLFRRESSGSAQDSRASSDSSLHHVGGPESPPAPGAILLIEEGGPSEPLAGMLGVPRRPPVGRRGSMLELGSTTVNSIPEEESTTPFTSPQNSPMSAQQWIPLGKGSGSLNHFADRLSALVSSSSSSSSSDDSSNDDDEADEKCAINRTQN